MNSDQIRRLLDSLTPEQKLEAFRILRQEFAIHPLETQLHTRAEIILEAIQRGPELTLRMLRGVIAEAAFRTEVLARLRGWKELPSAGGLSYDYLLKDRKGSVRVQVKLQRSRDGRPLQAGSMFVVETQKTRGGKSRKSGQATRPYRFGEFDILAVAMYPTTHRWDTFQYTVANWLVSGSADRTEIHKYQMVAPEPNNDWTDDFDTVVKWFRSKRKKTIA